MTTISYPDPDSQSNSLKSSSERPTLSPGQPVIWLYQTPHGWNWTIRVRATVVKVNAKTVTIDAELKDGGTVRRNVKPEKLEARANNA